VELANCALLRGMLVREIKVFVHVRLFVSCSPLKERDGVLEGLLVSIMSAEIRCVNRRV